MCSFWHSGLGWTYLWSRWWWWFCSLGKSPGSRSLSSSWLSSWMWTHSWLSGDVSPSPQPDPQPCFPSSTISPLSCTCVCVCVGGEGLLYVKTAQQFLWGPPTQCTWQAVFRAHVSFAGPGKCCVWSSGRKVKSLNHAWLLRPHGL